MLSLLQEENANSSVLGTMLGLKGTVKVPAGQITCAEYLSTVLEKWEKGGQEEYRYTWEVLKSALTSCGYGALVHQMSGRTGPGKVCLSVNQLKCHWFFCSVNVEKDELLGLLASVQPEWLMLGTFLGVNTQIIDQSTKCSKLMLLTILEWIKNTDPRKVTIDKITEVLESGVIGNNRLAKKIREDPEIKRICMLCYTSSVLEI